MQNNNSYLLTIQTPTATLFKGNVSRITIRTELGYMGLLSNHSPLLAKLKEGNFEIKPIDIPIINGRIKSGFIFFQDNEAIILSSEIKLVNEKNFDIFKVPVDE